MRTALFIKSGEFMGNDTQKIKLLALWDILKRVKKHLTNKCSYVIIQVKKLARKGFRAQYFNRNGDLTKAKRGNDSCRQNLILSRF